MIVEASVPARANLFGNPLDIYGGLVLSSSVALRAKAIAQSAKGLRFVSEDREFAVHGPNDLINKGDPFDFLRALFRALGASPDCEIRVTTDIPVRSGLAGSAALMLAASAAVLRFIGKSAPQQDILRLAYRAEVDFLGNFCGWNDFYACALGGAHEMNYREPVDAAPAIEPLTLPEKVVSFAVALTGDMHRSGKVNQSLWARWNAGDAVVRAEYSKLAELGSSARSTFAGADWPAFGNLMLQNFMCQYRLEAANETEHALVQAAMKHGALGAKLSGAGHCGSIVVLARNSDHAAIRSAMESAGVRQYFKIEPTDGLTIKSR